MGALSVTWDEHYRAPFQPLVPGIRFVATDDIDAFRAAVSPSTAAIVVEPIQGEGGVRPIPAALVEAIEAVTRDTGTLLIADEIQCGLGRTGVPFQYQALGLTPDLVPIGKALGGGMPVAASLMTDEVASAVKAGDHGTTYGGNLLACRAALCFLEQLTEGGLLAHVNEVGAVMRDGLQAMAARLPVVREVRGSGLMWGLDLHEDAAPVVPAALERGLIVNRTSTTVVRLLPPYVISAAEVHEGLSLLEAAIGDVWGKK
jgi:acetylornithine/succinyldiaminopimelate/putrescine aminotransferase